MTINQGARFYQRPRAYSGETSPSRPDDRAEVLASWGAPAEPGRNCLCPRWEVYSGVERHARAKGILFDYVEVLYNQTRRHSTLGQFKSTEGGRVPRWPPDLPYSGDCNDATAE